MNALEILPFILFIVVIVTAIAEKINLPYPLLLVVAGLVVGFIPGIPNWHPPSDVVLPVFLPPILFASARNISWRDIKNNISTIVSLSIILVLITTLSVAWVLNQFIPMMSFSAAMILGAIISPTDTVAATAILSNMNVKQNIIRKLEVESLFNDATGIVLYKAALTLSVMTGLNMGHLGFRALIMGVGGIAIGLIFSYFSQLIIEQYLTHSQKLPIIMGLVLAYVSYLFADRIGVSGVMSVVAAGLFHQKTERLLEAQTRLAEQSVWDTLIFFLNGIVFIIIGMQFPDILKKVNQIPNLDLLTFSITTIGALLLLRLVWVMLTLLGRRFYYQLRHKPTEAKQFSWRELIVISWSGMRGLVSLALAIALPMTLVSEGDFTHRDLVIFLTIITILFTLLAQGLTLPFLIRWLKLGKTVEGDPVKQTISIYETLTNQALKKICTLSDTDTEYSETAKKLVENYYANRLLHLDTPETDGYSSSIIWRQSQTLLSELLRYERQLLTQMRTRGEISEEIYINILRKLDQDEVGFASYH